MKKLAVLAVSTGVGLVSLAGCATIPQSQESPQPKISRPSEKQFAKVLQENTYFEVTPQGYILGYETVGGGRLDETGTYNVLGQVSENGYASEFIEADKIGNDGKFYPIQNSSEIPVFMENIYLEIEKGKYLLGYDTTGDGEVDKVGIYDVTPIKDTSTVFRSELVEIDQIGKDGKFHKIESFKHREKLVPYHPNDSQYFSY